VCAISPSFTTPQEERAEAASIEAERTKVMGALQAKWTAVSLERRRAHTKLESQRIESQVLHSSP
jgi:hypothetical protein